MKGFPYPGPALKLLLISFMALGLAACATVPGTGRSQLSLVGDSDLNAAAATQYREMLQKGPLSGDQKSTAMIKSAGARISRAAETYLKEHGLADEIPSYNWEFNLIESQDVNAFCMPGGKVAVYTGILPYCRDETGVAVIMGHEVAHAIAHHSRERASQQLMANVGGTLLGVGLGVGGASALTSDMAMAAYGLGSEVGILLPYSRAHESEADRIGLSLTAMAGYDPQAAVAFWERMSQASGKSGSDFLSTHPSDEKRIADIKKFLPEAEARYQQAKSAK
ncbi:MAG: M48 family metallopeptidase [Candidatus Adiutrix sp.]|jgi:predicted Zn-dependent protease|nr:M48 family metallopeptidase [Candidatus Adiutrix sp.]